MGHFPHGPSLAFIQGSLDSASAEVMYRSPSILLRWETNLFVSIEPRKLAYRETGFHERLSKYENSLTDVESLIDSAMVALVDEIIVGVCFLSYREDSNVRAVSLLAVDPEYQQFRVGRRLMESAVQLAKDEGATSIRLVVNAHSTGSFPLYASIGFLVKEPMSLVYKPHGVNVPAPEAPAGVDVSDWRVRWLAKEDLPACKDLADRIVGHNRVGDAEFFMELSAEDGYRPYRPWVLDIPATPGSGKERQIAAFITGFTWDNHSVAISNEHWKYLIQHVLHNYFGPDYSDAQIEEAKAKGVEEEEPAILLPIISQPEVFQWSLNKLRMRVQKNELLMAYGEYEYVKEPSGVYMPGVEY